MQAGREVVVVVAVGSYRSETEEGGGVKMRGVRGGRQALRGSATQPRDALTTMLKGIRSAAAAALGVLVGCRITASHHDDEHARRARAGGARTHRRGRDLQRSVGRQHVVESSLSSDRERKKSRQIHVFVIAEKGRRLKPRKRSAGDPSHGQTGEVSSPASLTKIDSINSPRRVCLTGSSIHRSCSVEVEV